MNKMIQAITNIEQVSEFFHAILQEGVNAHPDEDFSQFINNETDEYTYSPGEAALRNNLMNTSFAVCEKAGIDIYDLVQEIYLKETGLDQFIPLPSQKEFD